MQVFNNKIDLFSVNYTSIRLHTMCGFQKSIMLINVQNGTYKSICVYVCVCIAKLKYVHFWHYKTLPVNIFYYNNLGIICVNALS